MHLILTVILLLTQTIDHTQIVAAAKQQVIAVGINPDADECNRFEVTKRVAAALRDEGAGLITKPSGNNCQGFAVDAIMYRDGTVVDILGSGPEGPNTPHWLIQPNKRPTSDWAPPPSTEVPKAEPPATVEDHDAILRRIEAHVEALRTEVAALRELQLQDTEKIQQQIDQVVKNAEKSAAPLLLRILSLGTVR
jgi:hypothetical protein